MAEHGGADFIMIRECHTFSASAARCAHMMCAGLASTGRRTQFLLCGSSLPEESGEARGSSYAHTDLTEAEGKAVPLYRQITALVRELSNNRDATLIFYSVGLLFPFVALIARMLGMRHAYVQGDRYTALPGMKYSKAFKMHVINVLDRHLARTSVLNILTGTTMLSDYYHQIAPHVRVFQCFPPIDADIFDTSTTSTGFSEPQSAGEVTIAYFGTVGEIEGIRPLLHAFALLRSEGYASRLIIAGRTGRGTVADGSSEFEKLAATLGIGDSVTFTGLLDRRGVIETMQRSDILVMPRLDHLRNRVAAPIKLSEYLASGKAVVATRVGDLESTFTEGRELLLCLPDDPRDLADTIRVLLDNEDRRSALGRAGRERAVRDLDYRGWGRDVVVLLDAVRRMSRKETA